MITINFPCIFFPEHQHLPLRIGNLLFSVGDLGENQKDNADHDP